MKILLIGIVLLSGIYACRKENTTWYSDWVVPLVNDSLDLKNLTNDSTLSVQNNFYEVAMTRTLAKIKPEDYLDFPDTVIYKAFTIPIATLTVPPGVSFITDNVDHVFDLDEVLLKKIRAKEGLISILVQNPVNTTTHFEIELPSATLSGVPLKKTLSVSAKGSKTVQIDVSGYDIDLRGSSAVSFNSLPSKLKVLTDAAGPTVTLTNLDTTKLTINLSDIKVDYAQGYFGQYQVSDSYSFDTDIFKENISGMIDLPALSLEFLISNGIKAMAHANIKSASNSNSTTGVTVPLISSQLDNNFTIQNATGSWATLQPYTKSILFDENNSNIEAVIENLGNLTQVSYEMQLNPFGNISGGFDEFFPNSSLDIYAKLNMPLSIGLFDFKLKDTFNFSLSQNLEKTHIESGFLHLKLENAFPMEAQIQVNLLGENNEIIASFDDLNTIQSSVYGQLNALGLLSSKTNLDIEFPEDLIQKLDQIKQMYLVITFNTPNAVSGVSEIVSIPELAFLGVKAQCSFSLKQIIQK